MKKSTVKTIKEAAKKVFDLAIGRGPKTIRMPKSVQPGRGGLVPAPTPTPTPKKFRR